MIKVYIGELCPGYSHHPLLFPNLGRPEKKSRLFLSRAYDVLKGPLVEIVKEPGMADYFMLPHEYFVIEKEWEYLYRFKAVADEYKKKILIFDWSDYDRPIKIDNAIIFRVSQYKSQKRENVIVMPPFVEDLGALPNKFKSTLPTVGFVGYAGYRSFFHFLKGGFKDLFKFGVHKNGLYWRRKAINILRKDSRIKTNFLVRHFYSGHSDTIKMEPNKAREEYIRNITESDFTLAPKGDGNYSIRFFEVLSLGRVPILVDTDCILPLEEEVDYSKAIIRVPARSLTELPERVATFYANIGNGEFIAMQIAARQIFENHLRADKYFPYVFDKLKVQEKKN